jgi:hypothetical protein
MASTTSSRACPAPRAKPARSNDKCIGRSEQTTKCLKMETRRVFSCTGMAIYGVEDARFIFSNGYIVLDFPNQQYMAWVCETPLCGFFI